MPSVVSSEDCQEPSQVSSEAKDPLPEKGENQKRKIRGRGARRAMAAEGDSSAGGWLRGYASGEEEDLESTTVDNKSYGAETPIVKKPESTPDSGSTYSNPQFVPKNSVFYLHDVERVSEVEKKGKVWENSFEPTGNKKWGHDMYDVICDRNKKHTRVDHFEKSYGFQWPVERSGPNNKILCYNWKKKRQCYSGTKCRFSHGEDDERISRGICLNWNRGACHRGYNCRYFHGNNVWKNTKGNGQGGANARGKGPSQNTRGGHGLTRYYPKDDEWTQSQDAYLKSLQRPDSDGWSGSRESSNTQDKSHDNWSKNNGHGTEKDNTHSAKNAFVNSSEKVKEIRKGGDDISEVNTFRQTDNQRASQEEVHTKTGQRINDEIPGDGGMNIKDKHENAPNERVRKSPQSRGFASSEEVSRT